MRMDNDSFFNFPWNYAISDNFLNQDDLAVLLLSLKNIEVDDKEHLVFTQTFDKQGAMIIGKKNANSLGDILENKFIDLLHKRYSMRVFSYLKFHNYWKSFLYSECEIRLQISGKNYIDPIHTDGYRKLVTGVIYLYPNKAHGTVVYDKNGNVSTETILDWKVNRCMKFSRTNCSFHTFKGNGISKRATLVFNFSSTHHRLIRVIDTILSIFYCKQRMY